MSCVSDRFRLQRKKNNNNTDKKIVFTIVSVKPNNNNNMLIYIVPYAELQRRIELEMQYFSLSLFDALIALWNTKYCQKLMAAVNICLILTHMQTFCFV